MCGIIGYIGSRQALPILLKGLEKLEYRGYDSAGVVVALPSGFFCEKLPGKIRELVTHLAERSVEGTVGLGHTRWATHGAPTHENAHPHFSCGRKIALVHNGIIENYAPLKKRLQRSGHRFTSETDTEVVAHLLEENYKGDPLSALRRTIQSLEGSYALGVLFRDIPDRLFAARCNSPLVIGLNGNENFIASDASAFIAHTKKAVFLGEGELAEIRAEGVRVYEAGGKTPKRVSVVEMPWSESAVEKGGYAHFMLKEIHEQPQVAAAELSGRIEAKHGAVLFEDLELPSSTLKQVQRIVVAACGTAWHAGLVAKVALEEFAGVPVEVGLASELRYGNTPLDKHTLLLAISQSGETADTLAASRLAQRKGAKVLALTNVRGSTLAREADGVISMRAGLEIGVAATKTYTSQLLCVLLLALHLGALRRRIPKSALSKMVHALQKLPQQLAEILQDVTEIQACAEKFKREYDFMYIGRRYNLATAYEGALKMKEISYLHAEGYGAGEMKHGPLALVDERLTTIAIAAQSDVYEKMLSNIQEVRARKGHVIAVATQGNESIRALADHIFYIPPCPEALSPILAIVPLQLLAYTTAISLGRNVDQPRNLAKSVTVE